MVRGLETAAALAIIDFGVLLLTGYMVSERMAGMSNMNARSPATAAHQL